MLRNVKELKEKLTNKKNAPEMHQPYIDSYAQEQLLAELKKSSKN
jgi:hypothetical protein